MKHASAIAAGLFLAMAGVAAPARDLLIPPANLPLPTVGDGQTEERYVSEALQPLRAADTDKNGLDRSDIARKQEQEAVRLRASAISQFATFDLNGDLRLTWKEVEQALELRPGGSAAEVWRYDDNSDAVVTAQEVMTGTTREARPDPRLERLLAMDPNGDGVLTAPELIDLARQAFARVDQDHSGDISRAEYSNSNQAAGPSNAYWSRPMAACVLPPVAAYAKIVALGAYEGAGVSDVTLAGQDEDTGAAIVTVEPGEGALYLMLTSYKPIIWKIEGATGRVQQIVVSSFTVGKAGLPASGLTGVSRQKVRTVARGCVEYFYPPAAIASHDDAEAARRTETVRAQIAGALGRAPDVIAGAYGIAHIRIPSGVMTPQGQERSDPPAGFDPVTLGETMGPKPSFLLRFDPKKVYGVAPAERYEVLPKGYGLAQLVASGAIQRLGYDDYRIVRPIPRFPAGLYGGYSVRFVVAPGVPTPAGNPGHSCVLFDDERPTLNGSCGRAVQAPVPLSSIPRR